ncbi:MAG: AIR synthase-related protein, partial [Halobacteria archaeon]|nr:AIR synthase-related protein [Halobacteria archaeon]
PRADFPREGDTLLLVDARDASPATAIENVTEGARHPSVSASHDVSDGGLVTTLAEMCGELGAYVDIEEAEKDIDLFDETPGRCVFASSEPEALEEKLDVRTYRIGKVDSSGLSLAVESGEDRVHLEQNEINEALNSLKEAM